MTTPLINVMTAAVIKAGKGLLRDFGEADYLQISKKGAANFVTAADLRTEKLLQLELSKARPGFGFLLEEGGEIKGKDAQHRWIIDPVDGTNNFIHALPYFCISVGLEKKDSNGEGEIIAGVIFDPIHNELFTAEKGKGAFLGNRKLVVSARNTLEDSMFVTCGFRPSSKLDKLDFSMLETLAQSGVISRNLGATALDLAYLAAGRVDACWHYAIQPWDIAAGMLLVREAGGLVTEPDGKTASSQSAHILSSNRHLHPSFQKLLTPNS